MATYGFRYKTKIKLLMSLVFITLILFILLYINSDDNNNIDEKELNYFEKLQSQKNDVPIVVVDEHQEVIPFWYKAAEENLIHRTGNTLIHIDGHSDMAPPEEYGPLKKFDPLIPASTNNFLPLMQSNDVFIVSAIMKGLINHVIWVKPTWDNKLNFTTFTRSFIGLTTLNNSNIEIPCECQQYVFRKSKKRTKFQCYVLDRENENNIDISLESCKLLKPFTWIIINEEKFLKQINLEKSKNIFIDIDEDFFGVESGVQNHIDKGITLKTVDLIRETFPSVFCPSNNREEELLNNAMQKFFHGIILLTRTYETKDIISIRKEISRLSLSVFSDFVCKRLNNIIIVLNSFVDIITLFSVNEIKALSISRFCLIDSPQLKHPPQFTLCHGNIYPGDHLNQIYISSRNDIDERGKSIEKVLDKVYEKHTPKFYTIARSLRDGYTPRESQTYIEKTLLNAIKNTVKKHKLQPKVMYDRYLVFGKKGWQ